MAKLGVGNHAFTERVSGDSTLSKGWQQHPGHDSMPGKDKECMYIGGLPEEEGIRICKVLVEDKGWGGFVVSYDVAYFREAGGVDLLQKGNLVTNPNATLYALVPHWQTKDNDMHLLLLEFGRMTKLDDTVLTCPLSQSLRKTEIFPAWAKGAKIL
eukprot:2807558-Pyramimonas_sp.AAC.1